MSRAASDGLIGPARQIAAAPYVWPATIVACGCARAEAPTAAEALTRAIAAVTAELPNFATAPPSTRGIVVGTHTAARAEVIHFAREIATIGASLVNPALFPPTVMNAPAGLAAIDHHCEGPNVTLCNDATSAADAMVYAADLVAAGRAAIVFAGGFETRDPREAREASVAVITAITTAEHAAAASLPLRARLVATDSGPLAGLDPAAIASELIDSARGAAPPAIVDADLSVDTRLTAHPEGGLLALRDVFARASSASSPLFHAVVAVSDSGGQYTALLIRGAAH